MCEYCRKFTQHSYSFKEGYDVNIGYSGEAFIDFFNNLIIHLEGQDSIEIDIPVKYCPWCGNKLKKSYPYKNDKWYMIVNRKR